MGKPNMWNISKTANRRAKRMKIWDSEYYSAHMEGTFDAQLFQFGLGSFGALCKIFNFTIFKNFAPLPIFIRFIQTLYKVS